MKRIISLALTIIMLLSLCACAATGTAENTATSASDTGAATSATDAPAPTEDPVTIGVLVSDATTGEALGFRSYYENYIAKEYNVKFMYSDVLEDAGGERSAIESMVAQNCKAIISFSSFDRPAQIEQCEEEGVYYAVATGTLTDEQYQEYKNYEFYVGAIGPDNYTEYLAGYNMAKHYLDQGCTKFGIFGGALPYYTEMHIFRVAGMLAAMVEAGGEGANYCGATDMGGIVGAIYGAGCTVTTGAIGNITLVSYVDGYTMDDAWFGSCASAITADGLEAFLAVGNGADFFATAKPENVKIATVDSYVDALGEAMKAGSVDYLAGKFSSSIGPVFIATYRAATGNPIRTADGEALALGQGYWVANSYEDFQKFQAGDSAEAPAYTKTVLDTCMTADYDTFAKFVSQYSFDEISALAK